MQLAEEKKPTDCLKECNGACCQGIPICYFDAEGAEVMELRNCPARKEGEGRYLVFTPPCRFLNPNGLCSIYGMRPPLCKKGEIGGPSCMTMRKLHYPLRK